MSKMIISRLLLVNYKRTALSGITRFLFTPSQDCSLQMILGTNGSGKSSLMNELWPLPADENDYGVNGRKELDIDYNGKFYELKSVFEGKPRHEFIVDGVDLNYDGKIEMFRSLCLEHFGVSAEIRGLALEKDPLSNMGPSRRRYWLVKLADTDFTYAMAAYKKLQEAHRDAQGTIKRLQKRLVDERLKLPDDDVINILSAETREIKVLIDEIYGLRNAESAKSAEVHLALEDNARDLDRYFEEARRLDTSLLSTCGYSNKEDLISQLHCTKFDIESSQHWHQVYFAQHQEVKKKYDLLIKAGTDTIAGLEVKKKDCEDQVVVLRSYIAMPQVAIDQDPLQMAAVLKDIFHELYDRISSLISNDGHFSREKAEATESTLSDTRGRLNALQGRIARLGADIEHKRDHVQQDSIVCPKCQHSWSAKASEEDLRRAESALNELKLEQQGLLSKEAELAKYLKEYSEYAEAFRSATTLMRTAPILRNYFNEITQNGRLIRYPGSVAGELHVVQSDLEHHIAIKKQTDLISAISEQIELKRNLNADTLENIEEELGKLETGLGFRTNQLTELNAKLKAIENLIRQETQVSALKDKILSAHDIQQKNLKGYVYSRYQEMLWELIMALQTQLARKEDALSQINNQRNIVDEIQRQLDETIMNERVSKMAHIALSPTTGAIAEGLHRFINLFVTRMNRVIGSVWAYPLEIQTLQMDDGQTEMDYKFPFKKNHEEKPQKDVNEGSESMIDIFNFAFRVCALKQLGLGHLPLFLDEFESAFDDTHRERAIYFIKKLLDEESYGQIFMVSHYESNHGALSNLAQTCVLSKDNLMLPSDIVFNDHVTIN